MLAPNCPKSWRMSTSVLQGNMGKASGHHYTQPISSPAGMDWGCCSLHHSGGGCYSLQGNEGKKKVRMRKLSPDCCLCLGPCLLPLWTGILALLSILKIFFLQILQIVRISALSSEIHQHLSSFCSFL